MDSSEQGEKGKEKGQGGIAQKIGKVLGELWEWIKIAGNIVYSLFMVMVVIGFVLFVLGWFFDLYKEITMNAGTISKEGVIVWKDDKAREKGTNLIEAGINDPSLLGPLMVCAPPMGAKVVVTNGGFLSPMVLIVEGENKGCEGIVSIFELSPVSDLSKQNGKIIVDELTDSEIDELDELIDSALYEDSVSKGDVKDETPKPQSLEQEQDSNFLTNPLTYPVWGFQVWHIVLVLAMGGFWIWYEKVESDALYQKYLREEEQKERLAKLRESQREEMKSDKERRDENH